MTKEEIIELARQAGFERLGHDDCDYVCYPDVIKKFAQLIALECAQVCRNQSNVYALKVDRDNCAIAIEEHFGVEE